MIRFDETYPIIKNSKLFSGRYEENFILRSGATNALVPLIKRLFPNNKAALEILATTYFEPILIFQPQKSCLVRFRQRANYDMTKEFYPPKDWLLSGPGSLEIKIKNLEGRDKGKVQKMATFLPDKQGQDIYAFLKLVKEKYPSKAAIYKFINEANSRQKTKSRESHLRLIDPDVLFETVPFLSLSATRVNIRHSFDMTNPKSVRITIERKPRFYVYPINLIAITRTKSHPSYRATGTESPNREKIEIKAETKDVHKKTLSQLASFLDSYKIYGNKYTEKPYYKMIADVSKRAGLLVNEAPTREIETKANIVEKINIEAQIKNVWKFLLKAPNFPYRLFPTEPFISLRGDSELDRTIFGWKNPEGTWEEVATIIRMTDKGIREYGFAAIIKWKTDYRDKSATVLNRRELHEYLKTDIPNKIFLKKLRKKIGKKIEIVGVTQKLKYRIYIRDNNGRVFCLSLDECKLPDSSRLLNQLEIEYAYTILPSTKKLPTKTLAASCEECLHCFISLLDKFGVNAIQTKQRKIDFVSSQEKFWEVRK